MKWISVKDRLPEDDCSLVLITDGKKVCAHLYFKKSSPTANYYFQSRMESAGNCVCSQDRPFLDDYNVTHWMPLPEIPGKQDDDIPIPMTDQEMADHIKSISGINEELCGRLNDDKEHE